KKLIASKVEEERKTRIHSTKALPKVNAKLAERLMKADEESDEESGGKRRRKKKAPATNLQKDQRFTQLFEDEDFQIDEESQEFRLHNPALARQLARERFKKVDEGALDSAEEDDQISDTEAQPAGRARGPALYELQDPSAALSFAARVEKEDLGAHENHGSSAGGGPRVASLGGGNKTITFLPSMGQRRGAGGDSGRQGGKAPAPERSGRNGASGGAGGHTLGPKRAAGGGLRGKARRGR
ncbi:Nucleolar protein 10, partial [Cladochytrium tenue]